MVEPPPYPAPSQPLADFPIDPAQAAGGGAKGPDFLFRGSESFEKKTVYKIWG